MTAPAGPDTSPSPSFWTRSWTGIRWLLIVAGVGFAVHLIIPQVGELEQASSTIREGNWWWLAVAAAGSDTGWRNDRPGSTQNRRWTAHRYARRPTTRTHCSVDVLAPVSIFAFSGTVDRSGNSTHSRHPISGLVFSLRCAMPPGSRPCPGWRRHGRPKCLCAHSP